MQRKSLGDLCLPHIDRQTQAGFEAKSRRMLESIQDNFSSSDAGKTTRRHKHTWSGSINPGNIYVDVAGRV